jgi:hypothetical protein
MRREIEMDTADGAGANVDWADELAFQNELRDSMLNRELTVEDPSRLAEIDFARAAIAASLNARDEAGAAVAEAGAAAAAAVLSRVMPAGGVVIEWPEGRSRRVSYGAAPLGPSRWLRAVACALIARDAEAADVLCEPAHLAAAQLAPHLADAFWPFLCAAVAALIRQPEAAASWVREADALLTPDRVTVGDGDVIRLQIAPLAPLVRTLASPEGDLQLAFAQALEARRSYFARAGRPRDPQRLMSLELAGLAALAHDRGRRVRIDVPAFLIEGDFPRRLVTVACEYPVRLAMRPDDPIAFLDLEGFPRAGRKHVLVHRDDRLVARYSVQRKGVPRARAEFVLSDPAQPEPAEPRVLDAGERIAAADLYAQLAGTAGSGDRAAWLADAIEQIDAVLALIGPDDDSVPDAQFSNPRGLEVRAAEPGRFSRDRLLAYRDTLRTRADALAADAGGGTSPPDPRALALGAAAVVKETVMPILVALARDQSGEVLATLMPRPDDYDTVFEGVAVAEARAAYTNMWATNRSMQMPDVTQSQIRVHAAPAGMLGEDNELSRHFPGGYRQIARLLKPERVWVSWKYVRPGESSGLAFDGLVWCDNHWSWFPKPYRLLGKR